jgi:hypothetical protein
MHLPLQQTFNTDKKTVPGRKESSWVRGNKHTMVEVKILSGTNSSYLAEKIADYYGNPLCDVKMNRFSDGEMQPVIVAAFSTLARLERVGFVIDTNGGANAWQ